MAHSLPGKLRELRRARGWSLAEAARRAGIGKSTLSEWECGRHRPPVVLLGELLTVLEASPLDRAALLGPSAGSAEWEALALPQAESVRPVFADVIYGLRLRAGFSQARLAAALGLSQAAVSRWEAGLTGPTDDHLRELTRILQLTPGEAAALADTRGTNGNPLWEALLSRPDPADPAELFPAYEQLGEREETLRLLCAAHAARRRALVDARWAETYLDLAERYAGSLMRSRRDRELGVWCRQTVHLLGRQYPRSPCTQRLAVMGVLAEHRLRVVPTSRAVRLVRWGEWFHDGSREWGAGIAGAIYYENGDFEAAHHFLKQLVKGMERTEVMGEALSVAAGRLLDIGRRGEAVEVLERFWEKHWATSVPGDPYALMPLVTGARIYAALGDPRQAAQLLTDAERQLLRCDIGAQPASVNRMEAMIRQRWNEL
jgi:transcriptional regulator with XRE-family HTH domain